MSLPLRERGLKSLVRTLTPHQHHVAPFAGAWIEIMKEKNHEVDNIVAPFAGAWIEIDCRFNLVCCIQSRSLCGSVD